MAGTWVPTYLRLAKAHAFVDGNKRIAFAVMVSFLRAHGLSLDASEAEATEMMVGVAAPDRSGALNGI